MHKVKFITTWFTQFGVKNSCGLAQSLDLNLIQCQRDELEPDLITQLQCWTSLKALVAEWEQTHAAKFQKQEEQQINANSSDPSGMGQRFLKPLPENDASNNLVAVGVVALIH